MSELSANTTPTDFVVLTDLDGEAFSVVARNFIVEFEFEYIAEDGVYDCDLTIAGEDVRQSWKTDRTGLNAVLEQLGLSVGRVLGETL